MRRSLPQLLRYRLLGVSAAFLLAALAGHGETGDLEYFTQALHTLFHGGGLHLYSENPDLQVGPVAILVTGAADAVFGGKIVLAVTVLALALLLLTVRAVERFAVDEGVPPRAAATTSLVGGSVLAASWAVVVPVWGHVDDLLALSATVLALRAARSGRGAWVGALLGLAAACKPWAAFAVGVLVFLPSWRSRAAATAAAAVVSAVCWGPFVVADPQAVHVMTSFHLHVLAGTLPHLLGYVNAPAWVRPAQLALATALTVLCWRARRPDLVLLCLAVSRLALDGGLYPYYDAELVLGCLAADMAIAARRRALAWAPCSLAAYLVISVLHVVSVGSTTVLAVRLGTYLAVLATALVLGHGSPSRREPRATLDAGAVRATGRQAPTSAALLNSPSS